MFAPTTLESIQNFNIFEYIHFSHMQKLIGFNIKRNKKLLVSDIIKFFEVRGYELTDAHAKGMEFKRGNLAGNLLSYNPIKWQTKVDIEIIKRERLDYDIFANYTFTTFGLIITQEEKNYFENEAHAFSKAIEKYQVNVDEIEQLAVITNRANFNYMIKSLVWGILSATIIIFGINLAIDGQLPYLIASTITILSILATYFTLIRIRIQT